MSQRALTLACRDAIRKKYGWGTDKCELMPEGKPPAYCGEDFVAICEDGAGNNAQESLDEIHQVTIAITKRLPASPMDRASKEVIHKATIGAEVIADMVKAAIHRQYPVTNIANNYILDAIPKTVTTYGFAVPLMYRGCTRATVKGGDWFHGDNDDANAGVMIMLTFDRAERLQAVANQT